MVANKQAAAKHCVMCGSDVSTLRRYKDGSGQYYCAPCYARLAPETLAHGASPPTAAEVPNHAAAPEAPALSWSNYPHGLRPRITCPHCWHSFALDQILWVSSHADLTGDPVLGSEAASRFLPTRFTAAGEAVDARGMTCRTLACPRCRLVVPHAIIENEPLFVSIIGVPASGKSYFLTAMTWELRRVLPTCFALGFGDVDTVSNRHLNEYEETLFLAGDRDKLVAIRKTELQGELYDQIRLGQQPVMLPRPFLFSVRPLPGHPGADRPSKTSRVLCLYDNAGEHFQPGMDTTASPVTQHLAQSRVLMFLYDPTQDPRFRERCRDLSDDPQLSGAIRAQRQETILAEAAARVRRLTGLTANARCPRPLIVVVPKMDAWARLIEGGIPKEPFHQPAPGKTGSGGLDTAYVERVSSDVRRMLLEITPEFVSVAEEFCERVVYIPVSALGRSPEREPDTGMLGIRPRDVAPTWVTVPFLYMFAKWSTGLVSVSHGPATGAATSVAAPARG